RTSFRSPRMFVSRVRLPGNWNRSRPAPRASRRPCPGRSAIPTPALRLGAGLEWILGPGVAGVTGAEVLANRLVGRSPEARQVVGDLNRSVIRAEQLEQDRHATTGQPWGFRPSEKLLESDGQHGWTTRLVANPDPAPAGHDQT